MRLNAHWPALMVAITVLGALVGHAQLHPEATAKPEQATTKMPAQKPGPKPGEIWENPKDGLKYVWIPPGSFTMGCSAGDGECASDEKPAHRVTISKGFWIGQTEVTVAAYIRFAEAAGKDMPPAPWFNPYWTYPNMPMANVSWNDSLAYCQWSGGRLPTEAEWEYAARGGSAGARYGGLDEIAWYDKNSSTGARPVAQKRPNGFGLYDMLGNVWEWVNDWYGDDYYRSSPAQDPSGPGSGQYGVRRGGSWFSDPGSVRVSNRHFFDRSFRTTYDGVRCVGEVAVKP